MRFSGEVNFSGALQTPMQYLGNDKKKRTLELRRMYLYLLHGNNLGERWKERWEGKHLSNTKAKTLQRMRRNHIAISIAATADETKAGFGRSGLFLSSHIQFLYSVKDSRKGIKRKDYTVNTNAHRSNTFQDTSSSVNFPDEIILQQRGRGNFDLVILGLFSSPSFR